MHYINININIE